MSVAVDMDDGLKYNVDVLLGRRWIRVDKRPVVVIDEPNIGAVSVDAPKKSKLVTDWGDRK